MMVAGLSCPLKSLPAQKLPNNNNWNDNNLLNRRTGYKEFVGPSRQLAGIFTISAAKFGGFSLNSVFKKCETCAGQGAVECSGCKGTGKNKKNGNIFERWKCFECQGFGLRSCPECGKGGLTPEQRGER